MSEHKATDRNVAILRVISTYTARLTVSRETAIAGLTEAGFLTATGKLAPEYGGDGCSNDG